MSDPCRSLRSDAEAHALCRFFVHREKTPLQKIDTGIPYVNFQNVKPYDLKTKPFLDTVAGTANNGNLESGEIYNYALKMLERERSFTRVTTAGASLSRYLSGLKSFRPPWVLDDFDPRTGNDEKLRRTIADAIARMKRGLVTAGLRPNTRTFNELLTKRIVDWVVTPQNRGGLGVVPLDISPKALTAEPNALAILSSRNRAAHCTGLNYILYEIFRHAGIQTHFLLVFRSIVEPSMSHVCLGLKLDPNTDHITPVDLTYHERHERIGTPHTTVVPIPRATMLAIYFNNKASIIFRQSSLKTLRTCRRTQQRIGAHLARTLNYAPFFPTFQFNMSRFKNMAMNDRQASIAFMKSALKLYPQIGISYGLTDIGPLFQDP